VRLQKPVKFVVRRRYPPDLHRSARVHRQSSAARD